MTHQGKSISPLRRRMIEDMTLRKLSPKTQSAIHPLGEAAHPAPGPLAGYGHVPRICAAFSCIWWSRAPRGSR